MIGQKIKDLRTQHNFSQEALAGKLFASRELISKWKTNKCRPSYEMIEAMSLIFNVSFDDIAPECKSYMNELNSCIPKHLTISSLDFNDKYSLIYRPYRRGICTNAL